MTKRRTAACAVTITAVLAAGCSHHKLDQPTTPAYTHEQAEQMVERVIADEVGEAGHLLAGFQPLRPR
jgi:hypothetical protein